MSSLKNNNKLKYIPCLKTQGQKIGELPVVHVQENIFVVPKSSGILEKDFL